MLSIPDRSFDRRLRGKSCYQGGNYEGGNVGQKEKRTLKTGWQKNLGEWGAQTQHRTAALNQP